MSWSRSVAVATVVFLIRDNVLKTAAWIFCSYLSIISSWNFNRSIGGCLYTISPSSSSISSLCLGNGRIIASCADVCNKYPLPPQVVQDPPSAFFPDLHGLLGAPGQDCAY